MAPSLFRSLPTNELFLKKASFRHDRAKQVHHFCSDTRDISASEASDRKALQENEKRLDALQRLAFETQDDPSAGPKFLRASKRLADERGPDIIHAIMERATAWHDMEEMVFVPLVAFLPQEPKLKLLHQYRHSKRGSDRRLADELLTIQSTKDEKLSLQQPSLIIRR
jgi:hypothetical protein